MKETEARLGVIFPAAFVARMEGANGGEVVIEGEAWSLNWSSDLILETENARRWPSFPVGGVALASNGLGDHLVFLPDPRQPPRLQAAVFMWSHETGELDHVANDFSELGD